MYDYNTDLEIRKRNLNSYYVQSNPNNIDYYQEKQVSISTPTTSHRFNYTDDRNNRIDIMNKYKE